MDFLSGGAAVGAGVFGFLIATFSIALKLLLMSDAKDDVNYERIVTLLAACEKDREAGRERCRVAAAETAARHEAEMAVVRKECEGWRDRFITEKGDHP